MGHTALTRFEAFVRGCMLGLAINLSILPMAQAQEVSPPRPEEPAAITPIDEPIVTPVNPDPFDAAIEMQRGIYERLFQHPWDARTGGLRLDAHITSEGQFSGANFFGEPFTIRVATSALMDMTVGASPAEIAWIEQREARLTLLAGAVSNGVLSIGCIAISSSILNDAGAPVLSLLVIAETEYDPIIFEPLDSVQQPLIVDPQPPSDGPEGIGPIDIPAGPDPFEQCAECARINREQEAALRRTRDLKIENAERLFQAEVAAANANFNDARNRNRLEMTIAVTATVTGFVVAARTCLVPLTIPWLGTIAASTWIAGTAGIALGITVATVGSRISKDRSARAARDAAVNAAATRRANTISEAWDEYNQAVSDLFLELQECLLEHGCFNIKHHLPRSP